MTVKLTGGCLCGAVAYSIKKEIDAFYLCHCKQCKQLSGSAFASNLYTDPENIEWVLGAENVLSYEHPSRSFSKSFCKLCGSALPVVNKTKTSLIVPVGSLSEDLDMKPNAHIFSSEQASWLDDGMKAKKFKGFPGA